MAAPDIKAIIFDCFGVIYSGSIAALTSLCPEDKIEDLMQVNRYNDRGFLTRDEYIEALSIVLGRSKEEIGGLLGQVHIRDDEVLNYIKQLHSSYRTGLLSNVGENSIERLFTPEDLKNLFDVVVLSYQERIAKPSPEIFERTADRLGLKTSQCVMIDDLQENVDGAVAAGMKAIKFDNIHQLKKDLNLLLEGN